MTPKKCLHPYMMITTHHDAYCELRCMNPKCFHATSTFKVALPNIAIGAIYTYDGTPDLTSMDEAQFYGVHQAINKPLSFFVVGDPAPQGSKRHVGNGIMIEQSQKVKPWRDAVAYTAREAAAAANWQIVNGALQVDLCFWLKPPKTVKRIFPIAKPDRDKLERSTHDALVMAGCIVKDDSNIVSGIVHKRYALPNMMIGASITISPLESY